MKTLAALANKAPEAVPVITGAIRATETDLAARRQRDFSPVFHSLVVWPTADTPLLTADILPYNIKTSLNSSDYFRSVTLAVPNAGNFQIEGISGKSIEYVVKLSNPNRGFQSDAVRIEPESFEPGYDTIGLDNIYMSGEENSLFSKEELDAMSAGRILRRCQIFTSLVNNIIQTSLSSDT